MISLLKGSKTARTVEANDAETFERRRREIASAERGDHNRGRTNRRAKEILQSHIRKKF